MQQNERILWEFGMRQRDVLKCNTRGGCLYCWTLLRSHGHREHTGLNLDDYTRVAVGFVSLLVTLLYILTCARTHNHTPSNIWFCVTCLHLHQLHCAKGWSCSSFLYNNAFKDPDIHGTLEVFLSNSSSGYLKVFWFFLTLAAFHSISEECVFLFFWPSHSILACESVEHKEGN